MMNICDTNVLVALALPDDAHHTKAKEWTSNVHDHLAVPNSVLIETTGVLWNSTRDKEFIATWLTAMAQQMDIVTENNVLIQKALERYGKQFKKISLVDCQLIEWAKTEGAHILTFDKEIQSELEKI